MNKLTFLKRSIKIAGNSLEGLRKTGINVPQKAKFYDIVQVSQEKNNISIYSFRDKDNYLIKRLKINKTTSGDKSIQARFYEHLNGIGPRRKLSKVSSFDFCKDNKCTGGTTWDFYYPYNSKSVWFSKQSRSERLNNFPQSNGYIEDTNGFKIRPISIAEYLDIKKSLGRNCYIDEPWTLEQSITRNKAATDCIRECTVVGIAGEKGITLNHLNPNNQNNFDITAIEKVLSEQIQTQGKEAKAFILGSVSSDTRSYQQFFALKNILEKNKIPFSVYRTGDYGIQNFIDLTPRRMKFVREIENGTTTPFYLHTSQHIICSSNEIKITNPLIDKELTKGNKNIKDLIRKSFSEIE